MRFVTGCTLAAALLMPLAARATMTAVSNLADSTTGASLVDDAQFGASTAGSFTTGASTETLAGATIRFTAVPTAYGNFTLRIYTDTGGAFGTPGSIVTTLAGSAPTGAGDFAFTDPSATVLAANTKYWLAASTTSGNGQWSTTTDFTDASPIGWSIANTQSQASNFNHFWQTSGSSSPLFSIDVVATPEPTTLGLMAGAGLVFARRRR